MSAFRPTREAFLAAYTGYILQVDATLRKRKRKSLFALQHEAVSSRAEWDDMMRDIELARQEDRPGATVYTLKRTGEPGEPQADYVDGLGIPSPWGMLEGGKAATGGSK